jgi:hypothetical protein
MNNKTMVGENDEVYKASDEKSYQQTRKKYMVMFRENRTLELYVGRAYYIFSPYGSIEMSADIINHPDFKQQEHLFSIRES